MPLLAILINFFDFFKSRIKSKPNQDIYMHSQENNSLRLLDREYRKNIVLEELFVKVTEAGDDEYLRAAMGLCDVILEGDTILIKITNSFTISIKIDSVVNLKLIERTSDESMKIILTFVDEENQLTVEITSAKITVKEAEDHIADVFEKISVVFSN
ncbi:MULTISPECIES: hypothetical protein [Bacillaceae]|uniref:Uncharacterized protein n=1 Tax=Evansella alkalicola TaxID=745819 RepID=A0ABS6JN99_9BACI|nr:MULTISPECIES: hypothetical protein [Bacillaceae]MBU9720035.1 hypothetical protein [Bacillus alkalicola]